MIKKNNFIQQPEFNKKNKPLLLRLEEVLSCTISDKEISKIFDLVGRYTKKVKKYNKEEFYSNLTHKTFNPQYIKGEIILNSKYLDSGKKIAKKLQNSISLPNPGTPNYRRNLIEIMDEEYNIISKFYRGIKDDF